MGIYAIVNTGNGKSYVGCSTNLTVRFSRHRYDLRRNRHRNRHLQAAYNRYGPDVFEYRVLEEVVDQTALAMREQAWIDRLACTEQGNGYNLIQQAEHRTHAPSTIELMRAAHIGRTFTPEHRAKIAEATKGRPGLRLTQEQKDHLRQTMKDRPVSEETRAKMSAAQRGRPGRRASPEARAKMSAAHKGKAKSPEHRAKIGAARKGRPLPLEQRERLAALQRNRSAETCAKLSKSHGKLTDTQVMEMRQRRAAGESVVALAREYGLHPNSASDALRGKTYKRLPMP